MRTGLGVSRTGQWDKTPTTHRLLMKEGSGVVRILMISEESVNIGYHKVVGNREVDWI